MLKPIYDRWNKVIGEIEEALEGKCADQMKEAGAINTELFLRLVELGEIRNRLSMEVRELKEKVEELESKT